jgi:hypothetical protein
MQLFSPTFSSLSLYRRSMHLSKQEATILRGGRGAVSGGERRRQREAGRAQRRRARALTC